MGHVHDRGGGVVGEFGGQFPQAVGGGRGDLQRCVAGAAGSGDGCVDVHEEVGEVFGDAGAERLGAAGPFREWLAGVGKQVAVGACLVEGGLGGGAAGGFLSGRAVVDACGASAGCARSLSS